MVKATDLKRVEIESFVKSFLLFFISMSTLISGLFYLYYLNELQDIDKETLAKMGICNYTLDCPKYSVDFVKKEGQVTYSLYKNEEELSSFYPIKGADDFFLKIFIKYDDYHQKVELLHAVLVRYLLLTLLVVLLLSITFSLYVLHPLRSALRLTQEFVKDILHDFNTPISTMRLNLSLLSEKQKGDTKIKRIERSVNTILSLQDNLRHYLLKYQNKEELFLLYDLVVERVDMIERNYMDIEYSIDIPKELNIQSNQKALSRILDNLLSNASKYNKEEGKVSIVYNPKNKELSITDTGKGIVQPKRVFERFYKEQSEGIGVGLNIVKKLCDELGIKISMSSEVNVGTKVYLKL
ncbi:MAG: Putative sensor histidine kinase [uncultured Sulfurovum sp.]|uniref:histidine kinase n=1 Tax=uncultured Sulfurovum sp. TaxID=269237 RepID=A0A6S6U9U4_9BACT|nr:MAG: Putative sensor histidine kinase [uncultured Sulfurovum sp.]